LQVIDILLVKGTTQELIETLNLWKQRPHLMMLERGLKRNQKTFYRNSLIPNKLDRHQTELSSRFQALAPRQYGALRANEYQSEGESGASSCGNGKSTEKRTQYG
jgi:hypothetical protein